MTDRKTRPPAIAGPAGASKVADRSVMVRTWNEGSMRIVHTAQDTLSDERPAGDDRAAADPELPVKDGVVPERTGEK